MSEPATTRSDVREAERRFCWALVKELPVEDMNRVLKTYLRLRDETEFFEEIVSASTSDTPVRDAGEDLSRVTKLENLLALVRKEIAGVTSFLLASTNSGLLPSAASSLRNDLLNLDADIEEAVPCSEAESQRRRPGRPTKGDLSMERRIEQTWQEAFREDRISQLIQLPELLDDEELTYLEQLSEEAGCTREEILYRVHERARKRMARDGEL